MSYSWIKDWATPIIAVIALIQPYLILMVRKLFRPGRLATYPSGQVSVGYAMVGPNLGLSGTIRSFNREMFVHSIDVILKKVRDSSTHEFNWAFFMSPNLNLKDPTNIQMAIPSGFKVGPKIPQRYNVAFVDTDTQEEIQLLGEQLRQHWEKFCEERGGIVAVLSNPELSNVQDEFRKTKPPVNTYGEFDRKIYWEVGEYEITIRLHSSEPTSTFSENFKFELNGSDVDKLRLNVVSMMEEAYMGAAKYPYYSAHKKYL